MEYKVNLEELLKNVENEMKVYQSLYDCKDDVLATRMRGILKLSEDKTVEDIQSYLNELSERVEGSKEPDMEDLEKYVQAQQLISESHDSRVSIESSLRVLTWIKNMIVGEPKTDNKKEGLAVS